MPLNLMLVMGDEDITLESRLFVGGGCFVSHLNSCECFFLVKIDPPNASLFFQFILSVVHSLPNLVEFGVQYF